MLADLVNLPSTPDDWARWGFAHRVHHQQIRDAIQRLSGLNLPTYDLDPIPPDNFDNWLERNQLAHNDMNDALALQGASLLEVDFHDRGQAQSWIYLHLREHTAAGFKLGI